MKVTLEIVTESSLQTFMSLGSWTYSGVEFVEPSTPRPIPKGTTRYLCHVDGEPVGFCQVYELQMQVGDDWLKCAGIGFVGVTREHRNRNIGQHFMSELNKRLIQDGFAFSALYGFQDSFYRKCGYASVGHRLQINCPVHRLPNVGSELKVRRVESWEEISSTYDKFVSQYTGAVKRSPEWWQRHIGTPLPGIYAFGDPVEAYCIVRSEGFWEKVEVSECGWSSWEGYKALMSFYRGICINQDSIEWFEPEDGPFMKSYFNMGATVTLTKPVMFRLINPDYFQSAEFSFEVLDEDNGSLQLGQGQSLGRITVEQATHLVTGAVPISDSRFDFLNLTTEQRETINRQMPSKPIYHSILY